MDSTDSGSLLSWFQTQAGNVLDAAVAARYTQPYELEKLRLEAAAKGQTYTRDINGNPLTATASAAGVSPALLIFGGVAALGLLAVVLLKD